MAGTIAAAGLLIVLFINLPKLGGVGLSGTIAYLLVGAVIYLCFSFVEDIYKRKSGFYGSEFWPPQHYIKGPLMRDQGNNIWKNSQNIY